MSDAEESKPEAWSFEHFVECPVSRSFAWQFWTNVANWPVVDSSVEAVELDGPFAEGTKGTTKPRDLPPTEWRIIEVSDTSSARIEIPAPGAVLKCFWRFEDCEGGGTRITQQLSLEGEQAAQYEQSVAPELEKGIPQAMRRLADEMSRIAFEQA